MTDATKATVWQAAWRPWGEIQSISGALANNLRFPGQYFQIETGLAYNWHRHYDPVTGRYTQPDPLGFVDGPSIYAYARSSPYMHTDRDGRYAHILVQAAVAATLKGIELCLNVPMCRKAIEKSLQSYLALIARMAAQRTGGGAATSFSAQAQYISPRIGPYLPPLLSKPPVILRPFKVPVPRINPKEGAKNIPDWARGYRPYVDESGKNFAERLLDSKYGPSNYNKGPGSEFNKIQKYGDRSFKDPKSLAPGGTNDETCPVESCV